MHEKEMIKRLIKNALNDFFDKILDIEKEYIYAKNPLMERIREERKNG